MHPYLSRIPHAEKAFLGRQLPPSILSHLKQQESGEDWVMVTAQGHRSHPDSCFVLPSYVVVFLATLVLRSFASVQWVFGENYSLGVCIFALFL